MIIALTAPPLAPLLDRLFARADAATSPAMARVSRETGALLHLLAHDANARENVEFGASFGLSTLYWPRRCATTAAVA